MVAVSYPLPIRSREAFPRKLARLEYVEETIDDGLAELNHGVPVEDTEEHDVFWNGVWRDDITLLVDGGEREAVVVGGGRCSRSFFLGGFVFVAWFVAVAPPETIWSITPESEPGVEVDGCLAGGEGGGGGGGNLGGSRVGERDG